ncbi:MAG: GFA family protein [Hyphomicrobiales bacterium]
MTGHSGGCQCGAVRYHFEGPPGHASICHCRMCQKAFGNAMAPLVSVPMARFRWTRGTPSVFRSSPPVSRGFCGTCGTPLYMQDDGDSNIELAIATLDHPEVAPPTEQVGVESKCAWFDALPGLPHETTLENNPASADGRYRTLQHPDHDTAAWVVKR